MLNLAETYRTTHNYQFNSATRSGFPSLTDEQNHAVQLAKSGNSLKIAAFAGTGKTTTLRAIAQAMPEKRGLYVAFNKANADDATKSFPGNVQCRTAHSLAYREVGYFYQARLNQRLTGKIVADVLGIKNGIGAFTPAATGYLILDTIQKYTQSPDSAIEGKHAPQEHLAMLENTSDRETARRPDLIAALAQSSNLTKADASRCVDSFLDIIQSTLAAGESVTLPGFGAFR